MKKRAGEAEAIQHVLNQALLGSLVGTPVAQSTGGDAPVSNTTLAGVLGGAAGLSGGMSAGKILSKSLGRGSSMLPILGGAAGAVGLPAAGGAFAKRVAKKHKVEKSEKRASIEAPAENNAIIALGRELAEVGSVRAATNLGQAKKPLTPEDLAKAMMASHQPKTAAFQLGYVSQMGKQAGSGNPFAAFGSIVGALKNLKGFDNAGAKAVRGIESNLPATIKPAVPAPAIKPMAPKVAIPEDTRASDWAAKQQALSSSAKSGGGLLTQMLKDRAAQATTAAAPLKQNGNNAFAFK